MKLGETNKQNNTVEITLLTSKYPNNGCCVDETSLTAVSLAFTQKTLAQEPEDEDDYQDDSNNLQDESNYS